MLIVSLITIIVVVVHGLMGLKKHTKYTSLKKHIRIVGLRGKKIKRLAGLFRAWPEHGTCGLMPWAMPGLKKIQARYDTTHSFGGPCRANSCALVGLDLTAGMTRWPSLDLSINLVCTTKLEQILITSLQFDLVSYHVLIF